MPQLALAKDFLDCYAELDTPARKAVDASLRGFAEGHVPEGSLSRPTDALDARWRLLPIDGSLACVLLLPEDGDTFLVVTVLSHAAADAYCRHRRSSVNSALGVLELRDQGRLDDIGESLSPSPGTPQSLLFEQVPDTHFARLGVDGDTLRLVRLLPDEEYLEALAPLLPSAQYDALVALASGMTPEEAWRRLSRDTVDGPPAQVDTGDLSKAIRRSADRAVVVEGPEELRDLLAHPFDVWRTFLHPLQERIAYRERFSGPAMVTGGAGTGKSVTALHRVAHLASRYDGALPGTVPKRPVLLTTFINSLDTSLKAQLALLVGDKERLAQVEVSTIDSIAYRIFRRLTGKRPNPIGDRALVSCWKRFAQGTGFNAEFLVAEWEQVVLAQGLHTEEAYLNAQRSGRGGRLGADQRRVVWQALQEGIRWMRRMNQWGFTQLAQEAAALLEASGERPYLHVVVDESQDLHPAKWRLVRALVPEGPDDLFIAGDPHQRVYRHRVSLASVGVNVRGRSRRLSVSYRSTQQILSWAVPILGGAVVEGFDGVRSRLDDYGSPLRGRVPSVRGYASRQEETAALTETVQGWLEEGVEPDSIGVAARTEALAQEVDAALEAAGVETRALADKGGVQVGTMHSMKGLEFRVVAVVGADEDQLPLLSQVSDPDVDPVGYEHDMQRERNVLFVACTRARDTLRVSYTETPSSFLPDRPSALR